MINTVRIDDQPMLAGFFGEGKWLSDWVTPDQPDILMLWRQITNGIDTPQERITAAWDWVASQVEYKPFIKATINIEGKQSTQGDYWQTPSLCSLTKRGNCANKAFLLTSLVRNELSPDNVYCVLGNLYNGHKQGHAWVEMLVNGENYILEATRNDTSMVRADAAERYEAVHYFNDTIVTAVPGRTVLFPMSACYSDWLKDYLDYAYINSVKEGG